MSGWGEVERDAPQGEKVPCTGWKEMSFTEKTRDWALDVGD